MNADRCACAAALAEARSGARIEPSTATAVLSGCNQVSVYELTERRHHSHPRDEGSLHVCRTCGARWVRNQLDMDGPNAREWLEPETPEPIPPRVVTPSCGCAALVGKPSSEPLPMGREEQAIIDGCDVVAKYEDAIHYRCRSCAREWMYRRYDRGHVMFDFLEPV